MEEKLNKVLREIALQACYEAVLDFGGTSKSDLRGKFKNMAQASLNTILDFSESKEETILMLEMLAKVLGKKRDAYILALVEEIEEAGEEC